MPFEFLISQIILNKYEDKERGENMKFNSVITTIIAVSSLFAGGGIPKGVDFIKYDVLGKVHNFDEACMRHLISDHLSIEEECKSVTLNAREGFASITIRPDDCIVIKRKDNYGNIMSSKLLPDPKMVDKIKELYSFNDYSVVYASETSFDFGVHKGAFDYAEIEKVVKSEMVVIRTYTDRCVLRYNLDRSGFVKNWVWIKYRH